MLSRYLRRRGFGFVGSTVVYAFKQALMDLEEQGRIVARPSAKDYKKGTFADRVLVGFPNVLQYPDEPVAPHAGSK